MDKTSKVNDKGSGITQTIESDIISTIRNGMQQHKSYLGEVCNFIAGNLSQKYGGWWSVFVVDKDAQYGSRLYHYDHIFFDVTIDGKRFTIFKSSK